MTPTVLIEILATAAAAIAGVLVLARGTARASGWLLVAAAAAIPLSQVSPPAGAVPFTLSLLLTTLPAALASAAGVAWPVAPLGRPGRAAVVGALVSCGVVGGLLPAVLFGPREAGCNACPRNLVEIHAAPATAQDLTRLAAWLTVLWGPALVAVAVRRWWRSPPLARRHAWPVLGAAAGIATVATVAAVHGTGLPAGEVDDLVHDLGLAQWALTIVLCAGMVAWVYRTRTAGSRMARIVLAAIPDPATVIESLRQAVADPTLTVSFRRDDGTTVDLDGRPVDPPDVGATLLLSRDRVVFAEIRYDRRLAGSADLVRASTSSAGIALEYLAAKARLRAELRDVAALRARIVTRGDTERARLERNLHDGAQQRLIALGVMLSTAGAFGDAHAEIDTALAELRTMARGLFPASLGEAGVRSALRELGDHTACPLQVSGAFDGPVPAAVDMAVYQLVSEMSRTGPAGVPLVVALAGGGDTAARVTVTATRVDAATVRERIINAEDRFVAAGGGLTITATADGLVLEGAAPCAS